MFDKKYVWYASYGSNLWEQRFLCYILGGTPWGGEKRCAGCQDKTLPLRSEEISISHKLYFAKKSPSWQSGGVAFIEDIPGSETTRGRIYLITEDQFRDVVSQENNNMILNQLQFDNIVDKGEHTLSGIKWYNKIIFLGSKEDFPIFTFTHSGDDFQKEINPPSPVYLKNIIEGLKETFNFNKYDIFNYLKDLEGINDQYNEKHIHELFSEVVVNPRNR